MTGKPQTVRGNLTNDNELIIEILQEVYSCKLIRHIAPCSG